jgi:pyrroloquinoline quinone (PQQ) biosynthesis protein C
METKTNNNNNTGNFSSEKKVQMEISKMSPFEKKLQKKIKTHGAVDNEFLNRFATGDITETEFQRFAIEFYHFSREWPVILTTLLVNTADEDEAFELTKILVSELGDDNPDNRHELIYRRFLRSIDIEPVKVMKDKKLGTTATYIDGMMDLFTNSEHTFSLGAQYSIENMAIPMWDKIISGLKIWIEKKKNKEMDITFFTFHRHLEENHEESMANILEEYEKKSDFNKPVFEKGGDALLNFLEIFWVGLADKNNK